mmetsp:Transcript_28287/g.27124  ORF Transcript_28287/g.27124 Transcript_28287/m.27124 type:complete len:343 (+) Transcript_28287:64-1092(+)|eukprot:CAMPEP_0119051294 /NCGR_PEP_ID=MMETSP1177-20130426/72956_1 /TAXON_ID=2985 /ORGANISM="Ochromonas sp, Strain CCMP1899" /LENGTH=342 /DNA_ID=CAMNT_0007030445 /DNA_START=65 /DNA_END=1093 /DNA_ORIENTATION=+
MIAEPPISDIRAKAEARRAKTLARERDRLKAAKGEKTDAVSDNAVTAADGEDAAPKNERPLAARRNLVKKADDLEATTSSKSNKEPDDSDPPVESISEKKLNLTSQTTKDIEKEIAKNTASYEEKQKSEIVPPVVSTVVKKKTVKLVNVPLQPFQVMRFIRVLAIVALGVITGYRSAISNMEEVLTYKQELSTKVSDVEGRDSLGSFLGVEKDLSFRKFNGNRNMMQTGFMEQRTWFGWARNKVLTQTECTFTAVGVVWWASTVLAPFVTKALPKGPKGGMNIMAVVFSLYNNGFEGVLDTVLARISELALHLLVIIITAIVTTFLVNASLTEGIPGLSQEL